MSLVVSSEVLFMKVSVAVSNGFLCIAALAFPFSVAATNIVLGAVLAIGVAVGLWWQGAKQCWQCSRNLLLIFCAYFSLMFLGLIWSLDPEWGLHILGRQWFWLLVPLVVVLLKEDKWRRYFLISLSTGLALNLVFCVFQMFGYVTVTTDGSNAQDATGHIGHIGFGMVYGVWASWLLHLGWQRQGKWRWVMWLFAAWAYVMVFLAQGRGGYIVALILMIVVIFERFRGHHPWRPLALILSVVVAVALIFTIGPAKERWQQAWDSLSQIESGDLNHSVVPTHLSPTGQRIQMFRTSIEIWRAYPLLGVGTGGVPQAAVRLGAHEDGAERIQFAHPHNQYIFNLARWGVSGLLLLLAVFYFWLRQGWKYNWNVSISYPLVALTGVGLMIHGLFAPSMEEHFSGILAVLLLGAGLSETMSES
jgi:O-antigen ligase